MQSGLMIQAFARAFAVWFAISAHCNAQGTDDSTVMSGPCTNVNRQNCSSQRHGDIVLGGLFPLSGYSESAGKCVDANETSFFFETVQWVEAMRRAIEVVNNDPLILPGVRLGWEIRDTCQTPSVAVQEALKFIPARLCSGTTSPPRVPVLGVVGSYSSSVCLKTTNLLGLFHIPMISYAATNVMLSDARYNYFFRVLPSDRYSSKAISQMVQHYNWTYVSVVYTDDAFGNGGADAVRSEFKALKYPNVCVAAYRSIGLLDTLQNNRPAYQSIVDELLNTDVRKQHLNATVVVAFLQPTNAREFLRLASTTPGITQGNFTFIGVDSWGDILSIVEGEALPAALGALSPIPFSVEVPDFDEHLRRVKPNTHTDNPWLIKLWPKLFGCNISEPSCAAKNLTSAEARYRQSSKIALVYDAVQAYAQALHSIQKANCQRQMGVCREMFIGETLRDAIQNVRFVGYNREHDQDYFEFDAAGDPANKRYGLKNIVQHNDRVDFPVTGVFSSAVNETSLACKGSGRIPDTCFTTKLAVTAQAVWNDGTTTPPLSRCSPNCPSGHFAQPQPGNKCCWTCQPCHGVSFTPRQNTTCKDCPEDSKPLFSRNGCSLIAVTKWHKSDKFTVAVATLASAGIAVNLAAIFRLLSNWSCYFPLGNFSTLVCLLGILLSYTSELILIDGPTTYSCGFHEVSMSVGILLTFSPIFINALFQILCFTHPQLSLWLISPSQRVIAILFMTIPLLTITIISYVASPPKPSVVVEANKRRDFFCPYGVPLLSMLVYVDVMTVLTCLAAFFTIKLKDSDKTDQGLNDIQERTLMFSSLASIVTILVSISALITYPQLTDAVAKTGTIHLATNMVVTSILVMVTVVSLQRLHPKQKFANKPRKDMNNKDGINMQTPSLPEYSTPTEIPNHSAALEVPI